MARRINQLTARSVAAHRKPGLYGDGGLLYLQVTPAGEGAVTKQWCCRYMRNGRARKMGLGSAMTFSLAEARERVRLVRQQLADGIDPIETRLAERDARRRDELARITFKDAATKFIAVHEAGWRNASHRAQWRSSLAQYAYKSLGARPVAAIDVALINNALAPIWTTKAVTAGRVKQRIQRVVEWVKAGMPLPMGGATKGVKHLSAMPYAELPGFMVQLRNNDSVTARALEFTVLTAARSGESIGARWSEIDLDNRIWAIPAERMKAGKPHRVPLSDRAVEILNALPRAKHNDRVFAIERHAMLSLLKTMDGGTTVTTHGFRSAFRDWSAERTNFPREIAEAALAHALKSKVEASYLRSDQVEKRAKLMDAWSAYLDKPIVDSIVKFRGHR